MICSHTSVLALKVHLGKAPRQAMGLGLTAGKEQMFDALSVEPIEVKFNLVNKSKQIFMFRFL
jgi:hypothetical protein